MSLNEDRDKSQDRTVRMRVTNARSLVASCERQLTSAQQILTEAEEAYRAHFGGDG